MPTTEKHYIVYLKKSFTVVGKKRIRWPSLVPQSLRFPGVVKCGPREGNLKAIMRPRNIMRDYALWLLIVYLAAKVIATVHYRRIITHYVKWPLCHLWL